MSSRESERAPHACNACRTRKRGCDKRLPTCGSCAQRTLACSYDWAISHGEGSAAVGIGSSWTFYVPPSGYGADETGSTIPESNLSFLPEDAHSNSTLTSGPTTLGKILNSQVEYTLKAIGLSLEEVSKRFFKDYHRRLPVISPPLFYENLTQYQSSSHPCAHFAIVLLAICLMILPIQTETSEEHVLPDALYLTVKALFAQVQAMMTATTYLIQAGLLISVHEYSTGRADAAYVTIGTCARMAYTISIDTPLEFAGNRPPDAEGKIRALEQWNLWWGVVILERFILIEICRRDLRPATTFPSGSCRLPCDLKLNGDDADLPRLEERHANSLSSFGRQAQAVYFADRILTILPLPSVADGKMFQLKKLDKELQSFLMSIMDESMPCDDGMGKVRSDAIATLIGSLFLLHQEILSAPVELQSGCAHFFDASRAALDTAAKFVLDAAHDHVQNGVTGKDLPFCGGYNIRLARKHLQGRPGLASEKDIETLSTLERNFCERWKNG